MKICFYVIGASDFQDMLPVMIEAHKRSHNVRICVIDCLIKKRQFYYYKKEEITSFIEKVLLNNDVEKSKINIDFYGQNDKERFERFIDIFKPEYVFMQGVSHKFPRWIPKVGTGKVINFAWHMDSAKYILRGNYKVHLNILKREDDKIYYCRDVPDWLGLTDSEKIDIEKVNSMYFGNLRVDHLNYKSYFQSLKLEKLKSDKVCFITEAHLKRGKDNYQEVINFTNELLSYLKSQGFLTVWKKREKGFPKENWNSPLDFSVEKPDVVIEKDLNFPSSITYLPYISDFCFVINTSSAYWDVKKINKNAAMLQTKNPGPREEKYIKLVYSKADRDASFDLLNMQNQDKLEVLEAWLKREKNINQEYIKNTNASKNILDYLENEVKSE